LYIVPGNLMFKIRLEHLFTNLRSLLMLVFNTSHVSQRTDFRLLFCNVTGYLITSDHQLCRVTPLKTAFRLLIGLLQSSPTRNYNHNYFLCCVTFTQLTILHANIPLLTSTHIHTSNKHTVHTASRLRYLRKTLAEILLREFTS
jgi:hypothetical protein